MHECSFQRLRRSGYVFGRSDWCHLTGDMPGCPLLGERFFGVIPFLSYWPPKFTKATKKSFFVDNARKRIRTSDLIPYLRFNFFNFGALTNFLHYITLQKWPFNEIFFKISLRKDSPAHGFTYSSQVSRKSVKRKWPNQCMVFNRKKVRILPFCGAPGSTSPNIL